jgi:hypothetical protein
MTDEERQRAMDFIVEQSAKNSTEIERLNELYSKAEHRFDRDERILKLMIKAGRRARQTMRDHDKRFREQDERWDRLVESQAHTDRRLDALIDIVRADRNGRSASQ